MAGIPYKRPPLIYIAYAVILEHSIHGLTEHAFSTPLHLIPASCSNRPSTQIAILAAALKAYWYPMDYVIRGIPITTGILLPADPTLEKLACT